MENLLFIDAETFHDSKAKYDLRHMSIPEYVRDERFKVHGLGVAQLDGDPAWWGPEFKEQYGDNLLADKVVVAHNAKFDLFILAERYGISPLQIRDTKAMARAVLGRKVEDYSLRTLVKYYGLPEKGEMKTDGIRDLTPEQEKALADYCLHDVWLCREIYKRLAPEFPENQYPLMDQTIRMFVEPKLELNVELLAKTAENENKQKIELFTAYAKEFGPHFDLVSKVAQDKLIAAAKGVFSSNVKFPALLRSKGYVVPTKKSPRTGAEIPALALGDSEFLDLLESEDETLRRLCEARKEAKSTLMQTRCENLAEIGKTGAWPFDVEFSGAVQTHRYSGGGSAGGNPQNFTRDSALREAVRAPKGFSLVVGDFANIEMRLVAYLSGDPGLINAIEKGEDIYCSFASAFYGRRITKADPNERRFGKTAILGLGYGMGPTKFQRTVRVQTGQKIAVEEAKKAVNLYRSLYYKVPQLWRYLDSQIVEMQDNSGGTRLAIPVEMDHERILLPSGLMIRYPSLRQDGDEWVYDGWGKKGEIAPIKLYGGKVLENISQALAGELCKEVMQKFGDKVKGQIHDEIILVSDDPETDRAELEAAMTTSPSWLPQIKLEAEVGIGPTWLEAKHG